jgi:catechol 2,3-dioxygenase-like lactoylglutathione lyase family enzyme
MAVVSKPDWRHNRPSVQIWPGIEEEAHAIRIVTLHVTDQDKARAFYTEKLGFELRDDAPYGPDFRWLTVVSSEDKATELYLAHEDRYPGAKAFRQAMYDGGVPVLGFSADDIHALHRSLTANGVTFSREPADQEYGGIGAVDDGCGNRLNLHQGASG